MSLTERVHYLKTDDHEGCDQDKQIIITIISSIIIIRHLLFLEMYPTTDRNENRSVGERDDVVDVTHKFKWTIARKNEKNRHFLTFLREKINCYIKTYFNFHVLFTF